MKTLSLMQPWATLVAIGAKMIETRSWGTSYRGRIAIHASKSKPQWVKEVYQDTPAIRIAIARAIGENKIFWKCGPLPYGAILAYADLIGCVKIPLGKASFDLQEFRVKADGYGLDCGNVPIGNVVLPPDEPERLFGDYTPGRYAWIMRDIEPVFKPIPMNGHLGLWEVDLP